MSKQNYAVIPCVASALVLALLGFHYRTHARAGDQAPTSNAKSQEKDKPAAAADGGVLCGQSEPSDFERSLTSGDLKQLAARNANFANDLGVVTIPVCFHIIHNGNEGNVTDQQLDKQINVLNDSFRDAGFKFLKRTVDRTDVTDPDVPDAWFTMRHLSQAETEAKQSLRIDPTRNLNFYTANVTGALGWATFPWHLAGATDRDGVVILHTTMPDGALDKFNLGDTGTHEVGHWLGLYHTFQGGCTPPGDEISDTDSHSAANFGKPAPNERHNACSPDGKAPVRNFMNYVDDIWMTEFTPLQNVRMKQMVGTYRDHLLTLPERTALKLIK